MPFPKQNKPKIENDNLSDDEDNESVYSDMSDLYPGFKSIRLNYLFL